VKRAWLVGAGGIAAIAVVALVVWPAADQDPTETVRRTLRIKLARASAENLQVSGTTNLVDGAKLAVVLRSGSEELWTRALDVQKQAFSFEEQAQGALTPGTYWIEVRFDLAAQAPEVAEALSYQPKSLSDRAELEVSAPATADSAAPASGVLELINRVSAATPEALAGLDEEAQALDAKLWIAREKAALLTLRQAIAEARKPAPDRGAFERLLLEAHAKASLR